MEQFATWEEVKACLKALGKCTIFSFTLIGAAANLHSNLPITPAELGLAMERPAMHVGEGPYRVEVSTKPYDESITVDLSLQNKMVLFWADMAYVANNEAMGGYRELVNELSAFDYVARETRANSVNTGVFIVPIPTDPVLLNILRRVAATHALTWIVEDGSGVIHEGNMFFGTGSLPASWRAS